LSVQNLRPARPEEPNVWEHKGRYYAPVLPGEPGGLDYASAFRGLQAVGFNGYVPLNEPKPALMETEAFVRRMQTEASSLLNDPHKQRPEV